MAATDPIVITLPTSMFTFTAGAQNIRCYIKWYESNGKENFETTKPSDCSYTTSPDVVTFLPRSAVLAANVYELVIENYDADQSWHSVGLATDPLVSSFGETV